KGKLTAARYWMQRMIPECPMLLERIQAGANTLMEFDEKID
ncbi:MAG: acyl-CoA dehydrogenase C-terminal domain-containing protein, partial [Alphaproteobacteria bacterium]|nr:acyl-CoA dehydrogenase C-terminal domain-containing protein [Alphaproteobacteria bacterium]